MSRSSFDTTTRTKGLRQFITAADHADRATKKLVRDELREAAKPVLHEAQHLFARFGASGAKSASTMGISVRRVGSVTVEQRRRKTTGRHPEWGSLQMREALLPALETEQDKVVSRLEQAVDNIADRFERSP